MQMPGREYSPAGYRFGFNGQENDNDIMGNGNATTAEFWEYDSRLGRRWNIDILGFESQSPYACFGNSPIDLSDPYGLEPQDNNAGAPERDHKKEDPDRTWPVDDGEVCKHDQNNFQHTTPDGKTTTDYYYDPKGGKDGSGGYYATWHPNNDGQPNHAEPPKASEPPCEDPPKQNPPKGGDGCDDPPQKGGGGEANKPVITKKNNNTIPTPKRAENPPGGGGGGGDSHSKKKPPPPDPEHICWICFWGRWGADNHWNSGVNELATWLKDNPDENLTVISGGGAFTKYNDWDSKESTFGSETFKERLNKRYKLLQDDLRKKGVDPNRIKIKPGKVDSQDFRYETR